MRKLKTQNSKLKTSNEGQMLIILLMVMVVGMTIGLFLTSRTTTDISLTNKLNDSSRAFSAAEAGIEEAIRTLAPRTGSPFPIASGVNYTLNSSTLGGVGSYPESKQDPIALGKYFTVWFVNHNSDGSLDETTEVYPRDTLDFCFSGANPSPAVTLTLYYRDAGVIKTSYAGYDPLRAQHANNFLATDTDLTSCGGNSGGYAYHARIDFPAHFGVQPSGANAVLIAMVARSVYAPTSMTVKPIGGVLPSQGSDISSIGTVGEITRKINVKIPFRMPAPFLDHAFYTIEEDISK